MIIKAHNRIADVASLREYLNIPTKVERFLILQTEKEFRAMRIVSTLDAIEREAQRLRDTGNYDAVIVTRRDV